VVGVAGALAILAFVDLLKTTIPQSNLKKRTFGVSAILVAAIVTLEEIRETPIRRCVLEVRQLQLLDAGRLFFRSGTASHGVRWGRAMGC
jgi:hypothetical protein